MNYAEKMRLEAIIEQKGVTLEDYEGEAEYFLPIQSMIKAQTIKIILGPD
jgi:hypothetical protein